VKLSDVLRAARRKHLFPFVAQAFESLHPGSLFIPSMHIDAICHALERVATGEVRRLIVTVPPRYGKSICTAVAFPAWLLGRDPTLKILVASYGADLATKHARDFRTVISSDWYGRLFTGMRLARGGDRIDEQTTTEGGSRKAISLAGAATGFGADLIIIDDLMKAADATFPVERQRIRDYYEGTLVSRLNDKATGRIVCIQQRLHEDDLVGYLLERGQFTHLNLPAIAVEEQEVALASRVWTRREGDALCPERETVADLERLRVEMGPAAFSAQYQQNPTPPGGNRIRWEWFPTYDEEIDRADYQFVVQSWDTGMTSEPTSDYSVCTTWGFRERNWFLLDLERARYDFPDLRRRASFLARHWRADRVIVEKAGSGFSLVQQLRRDERNERFVYVEAKLDKASRVEAQTARIQTGSYVLPRRAPWLTTLRQELLSFPNGRHDDQVDSLVQFVQWSASRLSERLTHNDPVSGRPLTRPRPRSRWR
jgi:predicted phage terminase large subunit-like protein